MRRSTGHTWSGKAARRLNIDIDELVGRHIDLYAAWAIDNVRLPTTGFGIGDVAAHFNTVRRSAISGGFEAVSVFRRAVADGDDPPAG